MIFVEAECFTFGSRCAGRFWRRAALRGDLQIGYGRIA
jgi:hypothetical protein